jgi:hypothetical protein
LNLDPLWSGLSEVFDEVAQRRLLLAMREGRCGALRPADCVDGDGRLRLAWLRRPAYARSLLDDSEVLARLEPAELLALGSMSPLEPWGLAAFAAVDAWMSRDRQRTMGALIAYGAWRPWRTRASLSVGGRRTLAMLWLMHPAHPRPAESERLARSAQGTIPYETWSRIMEDLGGDLGEEEIVAMTAPATHWPWIHPFERRQIHDLAERCRDLGALAALVDAHADLSLPLGGDLAQVVLAGSRFSDSISPGALAWLRLGPRVEAEELSPPSLDESAILCTSAGMRLQLALKARARAVVAALDDDPSTALEAIERPMRLWGTVELGEALGRRLEGALQEPRLPLWIAELDRRAAGSGLRLIGSGNGLAEADLGSRLRQAGLPSLGDGLGG